MAVYYKFKSAKDYDSIPIDGHFISVANLKEKIFESKHLGRGTDFDLMVSNAQTNEDYLDEAMLIPKNTSVVVRRVPGRPRMPIVTERDQTKMEEIKVEDAQLEKGSFHSVDSSVMKYPEETEWDEFGNDLYSIPEVQPVQLSNPVQDALPNRADEDSKIKALIDTPALDWQRQAPDGFSSGRGFGRGMGGRMMGGRGFGRGGIERKTPPQGYVCHRCKVPGHFIQHCPTNGDPNYDIRRVKPPTGIPKSMLMATPDGSYALPSGAVAVLKPNEAAFEREIEGLPSTKSVSDLPPELHCPLCKEVMRDAVLTSKCCFNSFCDKCIREHIISKSMCVCGATNILTDDLLPNKTLRDTINRILESNNSSAENVGSMVQVQDVESARCPVPKVPSPALSFGSKAEQMPATMAASNGEQMLPCHSNGTPDIKKTINEDKTASSAPQQLLGKDRQAKTADVSGATLESASVREPTSQGSVPLADEEVQQRLATGEPGKKKKKKKARLPVNATDMQWRTAQDLAAESYMFPFAPSGYNPYWADMQLGMNNYMTPFTGSMPYMGYTPGPFDVPYGGMLPQDPFAGQSYMFPPVPPQRDLSELSMGAGAAPAILSREEFEARKADLRRKREIERRGERECSKDKEGGREMNSNDDVSSMKSKHRPSSEALALEHHRHRAERVLTPERATRGAEPVRSGKRKSEERQELRQTESNAQKRSVFARISFPESSSSNKKRKETPNGYKDDYDGSAAASTHHKPTPNGYHHDERRHSTVKTTSVSASGGRKSAMDHDSSDDDDRHFKRRPSRYEPPPVEWEEDVRPSRGSSERERERDRDRSSRDHERGYSKHR